MQKRGQVTLFVIVGVFLLIVFTFLMMVSDDMREMLKGWSKEEFLSQDYNEGLVRNTMKACMTELGRDAVYQVALHGGYLSATPKPSWGEAGASRTVPFPPDSVPVLLDAGGFHALQESEVTDRLCSRVYVDLDKCLDPSLLEEEGFTVSQDVFSGDFSAIKESCTASLKDGSVAFKISFSVALEREGFATNVSEYYFELAYDLKKAYDVSRVVLSDVLYRSEDGDYSFSDSCANYEGLRLTLADGEVIGLTAPWLAPEGLDPLVFQFGIKDYNLTGGCG